MAVLPVSSAWVELAVAALLMFMGGYGMAEGFRAWKHGVWLRDIVTQMPMVGIGVILNYLGCWMAAQALVSLHP